MVADPLELAWQEFLARDHPIATALALENAELDNERFTKLQQTAQSGKPKARGKAAEELAKLGADIGSALVLDALAASALDALGRADEALALRVQALAFTPVWQPLEVGRVVGNIGWTLFSLGRLDEAVRWLERALGWDPVDPFVLCNLGETHAAAGSLPTARAIAAYLGPRYPEAHVADLAKALGKVGPEKVEPFRPRADELRSLERRQACRFATAVSFDRNQIDKSALRSHALVAAMCGRLDYARLSAGLAVQCGWTGIEARGPIEEAWCRALVEALDAREDASSAPRLPLDPEARVEALRAARRAGDKARLVVGLHEPEVSVRMQAAAELAVGLGADDLDEWLLEQAAVEDEKNLDLRPFADVGWTASSILHARKARRGLESTPLSVVPREGAEQPMLGAFDPGDVLMMWIQFASPPEPHEQASLQAALARGDEILAAMGVHPLVEGFDDPLTLQLAFGGTMDPALVARTYLAELAGGAQAIRDVVVGRFLDPSTQDEGDDEDDDDDDDDDDASSRPSLRAVDDPRVSTEWGLEGDDWWNASFDTSRAPPASEPESGLMMMMPWGQGYAVELRLAPPWFPDVRVSFGLAEVEYVEVPGTQGVVRELHEALHLAFRGAPPIFRNAQGTDGAVDGISSHGRLGWALALPQLTPAMVQHLPRSVRFREHELLGALADVVRRLGLAPVVHWYRGDGLYVLNLWSTSTT